MSVRSLASERALIVVKDAGITVPKTGKKSFQSKKTKVAHEKRVSEDVLPMVRRLDLREKQCTASVSSWCSDVK